MFDCHGAPAVCAYLVLVYVRKDMSFISSAIDVKMIKLPDKSMVSSRLRCILRIKVNPFILECLVLSEIVEVIATLTRISTKKENAIFKGKTMSA